MRKIFEPISICETRNMSSVVYFVIVGHNDHPVFEIDLSKSNENQAKVRASFIDEVYFFSTEYPQENPTSEPYPLFIDIEPV